tara:strand:+ start:139 stop:579 length:441 start_codon:yes stop_codon:yes gene_type:complete
LPKYDYDRDLGFWELPSPKKKDKTWYPVVRVAARAVPFGYEIDPDNEKLFMPIPHELEALLLAKKHLRQYSYREVANWLTTQTGRSISHVGLQKRIAIERRRKKASIIKRRLAKRLQETLKEIDKLEKGVTGYYTTEEDQPSAGES